ncbi:MAG: DegV family protein [Lachnospiraceae bacterium]|nr:DegV family protein [Lachnospiraceae bacterium]
MVKIIADSTCDLSPELLKKYDISILPLHVLLGEKEYFDGVTVTPGEIFAWAESNRKAPKTSAPALEDAVELFRPYVEAGQEIVSFSIADGMSSSGNIMRMAARELNAEAQIFVVDSANLSTGIGLLVIEAAIMAQNGRSAAQIVEKMEEIKPRVRASFVVDTLMYLYRGGRCSGLSALAGSALKIHPKILVSDGKMSPDKKYRGSMRRVVMAYAHDLEEQLKMAETDRVFITHSGCSDEVVGNVRAYLEQLHVFHEILETTAGGVVSCHCGPGTLGILFIAKG